MAVSDTKDASFFATQFGHPWLPAAYWQGFVDVTGDGSGGAASLTVRLEKSGKSNNIFSVEGHSWTVSNAAADPVLNSAHIDVSGSGPILTQNAEWGFAEGYGIQTTLQRYRNELKIGYTDSYHWPPLTHERPVALAFNALFAVNVNAAVYELNAWGYLWTHNSYGVYWKPHWGYPPPVPRL